MGWTDIIERVSAKSRFDASVRLYQRGPGKPALIVALRTSICCDLKWKAIDTFGLAVGEDENKGKLRIIRRKDKWIAKPRQMKTGALTFDFGYVHQFGERGTLKAEAVAAIIDVDTVEIVMPVFEFEDEQVDEGDDGEPAAPAPLTVAQPQSTQSAKPVSAARPANGAAGPRAAPVTIGGIRIDVTPEEESVTFRGKEMEVTGQQAMVIATLARAMPQPVGRDFIIKKVFPTAKHEVASMSLDQIYLDLSKALPGIGLQLKNHKGIGLVLSEAS